MRAGILSDSHGDALMTRTAISLLGRHGASKYFHCGDLCSTSVLDELAGHDCVFVWGNCDDPTPRLARYVTDIGLPVPQEPTILTVNNKKIGVFHGHEQAFQDAREQGGLDYIFYGHTHRYADHRENNCRLINPGALYRARPHTVAVLDLESDQLTFLVVETGERLG